VYRRGLVLPWQMIGAHASAILMLWRPTAALPLIDNPSFDGVGPETWYIVDLARGGRRLYGFLLLPRSRVKNQKVQEQDAPDCTWQVLYLPEPVAFDDSTVLSGGW